MEEGREGGSEGEIEMDRYHFGLDISVSPVLLNAIVKDDFFFFPQCIGIARIFNIIFAV